MSHGQVMVIGLQVRHLPWEAAVRGRHRHRAAVGLINGLLVTGVQDRRLHRHHGTARCCMAFPIGTAAASRSSAWTVGDFHRPGAEGRTIPCRRSTSRCGGGALGGDEYLPVGRSLYVIGQPAPASSPASMSAATSPARSWPPACCAPSPGWCWRILQNRHASVRGRYLLPPSGGALLGATSIRPDGSCRRHDSRRAVLAFPSRRGADGASSTSSISSTAAADHRRGAVVYAANQAAAHGEPGQRRRCSRRLAR